MKAVLFIDCDSGQSVEIDNFSRHSKRKMVFLNQLGVTDILDCTMYNLRVNTNVGYHKVIKIPKTKNTKNITRTILQRI